ncbi:MAG: vWA domain-containing protein [Actinomycetota bacterium]
MPAANTSLDVLVSFTHRLRQAGIPVAAGTAGEVVRSLELVGLAGGEDVYYAMRSLTCTGFDHLAVFDRIFVDFFRERHIPTLAAVNPRPRTWSIKAQGESPGVEDATAPRVEAALGASDVERLRHRDFASLSPAEMAQVRNMIKAMLWEPALAYNRRRKPQSSGDRPDLRRTLRNAVRPEGDVLRIEYTGRRLRRRPLVFLADVSGSMERYSEMLLHFAHGAGSALGRVEAFAFATHLTRITRQLRHRDPSAAIAEVADEVTDWSSGTRIGSAIAAFNREWSRRVGRGGPIALIVSDGWDRGEPDLLSQELARLRRSVHRVMWLNPIAGRPDYLPLTRGIKAALPHVDDFLPVTNLSNLERVVEVLEAVSVHRPRRPVDRYRREFEELT